MISVSLFLWFMSEFELEKRIFGVVSLQFCVHKSYFMISSLGDGVEGSKAIISLWKQHETHYDLYYVHILTV